MFSAAPVSSHFDGMVIGGSLEIGGRTTLLVLFGSGNALSIIRQAFSGHQLEIEIGRNTSLLLGCDGVSGFRHTASTREFATSTWGVGFASPQSDSC